MQRAIALFQEADTVDELGVGTIRDAFADELFPGTSTIQTRLRYFLIVPWVYRGIERSKVPAVQARERARKAELALIDPLLEAEDNAGAFGKSARQALKPEEAPQPPKRSERARSQFVVFLNFMMSLAVFLVIAGAGAVYFGSLRFEETTKI